MIATFSGNCTASKSLRISSACFICFPWVDRSPLSFHMAPWVWTTPKAYLESIQILIFLSLASSHARVKAIISAFCAEVLGQGLWTLLSDLQWLPHTLLCGRLVEQSYFCLCTRNLQHLPAAPLLDLVSWNRPLQLFPGSHVILVLPWFR